VTRGSTTRPGDVTQSATLAGTRVPGEAAADEVELEPGAMVGRYSILHELARGGMGVVYAAYDPELDRRIALKLLRSTTRNAADDKSPRARLLREAQAMARVVHPNVVTVHDVGLHRSDVFVAMELIEGGTLKSWIATERRGWREVLDVLCRAGAGLMAAHAQGVVHRDFKPENVLVGHDGRVAVADFGLARAADGALDHIVASRPATGPISTSTGGHLVSLGDDLTRTGAVLGTPAYMSPEQHRGQSGDPKTDVFSFCVTAYEALHGARPFEGATIPSLAANVLRGLVKPPPAGSPVPAAVHQALMRGLVVDSRKRPTMRELLAELSPEPKHGVRRWGLPVAGLVIATAVGGYALGTSGDPPCVLGHERLAGVWDDEHRRTLAGAFAATERPFAAELSTRTQASLDRFAERWLEQARAVCEATHVQRTQSEALLDLRMGCLDRRVDELRVAVRTLESGDAELLSHALEVVHGIPALSACEDAEQLRRTDLPPDLRDAAAAIRTQLAEARTLRDGGTPLAALPLAEQATAQARSLSHPLPLAEALLVLADVHQTTDRVSEARVELEEAMAAAIEAGDDRLAATVATAAVYTVGYKLSDVPGAEGWDRQARGWLARLGRPDELEARRLDARGIVYLEVGRHEQAMVDLHEVQALQERALEANDPGRATTLSHIGDALIGLGRYEEAVEHQRRALRIYEAVYGPDHPKLLAPLNNLGVSLQSLARFDEARAAFERTHALAMASVGPESRSVALALRNMSEVDRDQGKVELAIDEARRAVAIYQRGGGTMDHGTSTALAALATSLAAGQQFEEATGYFRQVHAAQVELFGQGSLNAVFAENNLGTVLAEQGRHDEGLVHLHNALAGKERLLGAEHPGLVSTLSSLGESLLERGEARQALPYFERAERLRKATGPEHPGVASARLGRGQCHLALGEVDVALPLLEQALELRERAKLGPRELAQARFAVARAVWRHGDHARAEALAEAARAELASAEAPAADELREMQQWLDDRATRG
jgi:tetratricopeptide (TPR) repeat protein/predicted Ser/Thr protein kinase